MLTVPLNSYANHNRSILLMKHNSSRSTHLLLFWHFVSFKWAEQSSILICSDSNSRGTLLTGLPIKNETSETTLQNVYGLIPYIYDIPQLKPCFFRCLMIRYAIKD